jgi:hypothetical protein
MLLKEIQSTMIQSNARTPEMLQLCQLSKASSSSKSLPNSAVACTLDMWHPKRGLRIPVDVDATFHVGDSTLGCNPS